MNGKLLVKILTVACAGTLRSAIEIKLRGAEAQSSSRKTNGFLCAFVSRWLILIAVLTAWMASAATNSVNAKAQSGTVGAGVELPRLVAANTGFAIQLYHQLRSNNLNVAFSPYGLSSALTMTLAGAEGQTALQMEQTLQLPAGLTNLQSAFGRLDKAIQAVRQTNQIDLSLASSLWPVKHYLLRQGFLNRVETNYHAPISPLDFLQGSERSRQTLNAWVTEHTAGRVTNLFTPGTLGRNTRLVLLNAAEFKGRWPQTFASSSTTISPFHLNSGTNVNVALMHQSGRFGYLETRQLQMLSLPYAGEQVDLLLMLPRKPDGLESLERSLTPAKLAAWIDKLRPAEMTVALPEFKVSTSCLLNTNLVAIGMKDAFNADRANFAGIDGATHWLYLNQVRQEVSFAVDEAGTVATTSPAAEIRSRLEGLQKAQFTADRPFLFFVRERSTGSILFLGRLMNPTS